MQPITVGASDSIAKTYSNSSLKPGDNALNNLDKNTLFFIRNQLLANPATSLTANNMMTTEVVQHINQTINDHPPTTSLFNGLQLSFEQYRLLDKIDRLIIDKTINDK